MRFLERFMYVLTIVNVYMFIFNALSGAAITLIALNAASACVCFLLWRVEVTQRHFENRR